MGLLKPNQVLNKAYRQVAIEDKKGVRYDGFFKQGKKHGAFVETDKNGNVICKGVYKFGTLDAEQK